MAFNSSATTASGPMATKGTFSENTRVQIPAALHLVRLGYTYLSRIDDDAYDHRTNILKEPFAQALKKLNPDITDARIEQELAVLSRISGNDDLGREFYTRITQGDLKFIDFDDKDNNLWHVTTEFTCRNDETQDEFRPDLTVFINGLPLAFIEVKKPNNHQGILAERSRINTRMANKAFRTFFGVTQLMIFSNNEEYNTDSQVPISGAFYAAPSKTQAFFNVFREADPALLGKSGYEADVPEEVEREILIHRNCPQLRAHSEYKTNQNPNSPTNRIITSMLSKDRFLFILKYGIAYVDATEEKEDGTKIKRLEKHIMRYQQLFATYAIRETLDHGKNSGIIWHTQGSGKTALAYYNVKSLTDYFAAQNTPVKFYFIVDRLDLLEQASTEFADRGLIVRQAQDRESLMNDFKSNTVVTNNSGAPEIMVVNIQKFATDHQRISKKEVYNTNLKRVFFIDEAHRGYSPEGSFLANLFDADKDSIKIALTGTPLLIKERESWRVFGDYIDTYYYDKSIADGYTLRLMREDIETIYKQQITEILDRLTNSVQVRKKDIDHNTIIEHESYINGLLNYIFHDIRRSRIQQAAPHMAGMIVCETNPQARELYRIFEERNRPENLSPGEKPLKAVLILHDEGDKLERKGSIEEFKKKETIDFLIVNAMLLTGFDAKRLKKLYLCRKLDGHNLLQALTRVNRPYRDFKYGYVVDFANIKENFIETNNLYMRELNRTTEELEGSGQLPDVGPSMLTSNEEVIQKMEEIKEVLFQYSTENAEEFSQQLASITDKEQLYELRRILTEAKALVNQVRSFGDDELQEKFSAMELGAFPVLITEVNHRIDRINLLENTDHTADVSGIIREALSMLEFNFKFRGNEELQIVYNDLKERYDKVESEFNQNIDHQEDAYITLAEDFRKYFAKRGFTPDTVEEAKEDIGYMDLVMEKIREINRKNAVLRRKYNEDEKFVRVHKRLREENEARAQRQPKEKAIISESEVQIANSLNIVKKEIDNRLLLNINEMNNEQMFTQFVMSSLTNQLHILNVEAPREDRTWLRNHIAGEYLSSFNQTAAAI